MSSHAFLPFPSLPLLPFLTNVFAFVCRCVCPFLLPFRSTDETVAHVRVTSGVYRRIHPAYGHWVRAQRVKHQMKTYPKKKKENYKCTRTWQGSKLVAAREDQRVRTLTRKTKGAKAKLHENEPLHGPLFKLRPPSFRLR